MSSPSSPYSQCEELIAEALRLQSSDLPRALTLASRAYELADECEPSQSARASIILGALLRMRGNYQEAERLLLEGIEQASDLAHRLSGQIQLGQVYLERGMRREAALVFERALAELGVHDLPEKLAAIHLNLGNTYSEINTSLAVTHYSRALTAYNKIADETGIATVLANMGVLAQQEGRHEEAITTFAQSSRLLHSLGEERLRAILLHRAAISHLALGEHSLALNECEAAAEISATQRLLSLSVEINATKSDLLKAMGSNERARDLREEADLMRAHLRLSPPLA